MKPARIAIMALALSAIPALASPVPQHEVLDHNGSIMIVDYREQTIRYMIPKRSLAVESVQMSFAGTIQYHGVAQGIAYVYKRGCGFAMYEVKGGYDPSIPGYVMVGAAPVREKGGCHIVGYTMKSPNARLVYKDIEDQAAYFGDI
jgi:hypothetical protein